MGIANDDARVEAASFSKKSEGKPKLLAKPCIIVAMAVVLVVLDGTDRVMDG